MSDWKDKFKSEISRAKVARDNGNEGMARVCARRAAGMVVREYLQSIGQNAPTVSAYDQLRYLQSLPNLSEGVKQSVGNLLTRVNTEHQLPVEVDLIRDAELLFKTLAPE